MQSERAAARALAGYDSTILKWPRATASLVVLVTLLLGAGGRNLRLDASSDTLILDGDVDLAHARLVTERYGGGSGLVVTFTPAGDLLARDSLEALAVLRDELRALPCVASVTSLLDVPLLRNPPVPLAELRGNLKTLDDPAVDLELALNELASSPLYQELLVSPDMRSSAISLQLKETEGGGSGPLRNGRRGDIAAIRSVLQASSGNATVFLGGVPMITNDIVAFIRNDLATFGFGILLVVAMTLLWAFRDWRWVVLPLLCSGLSVVTVIGLLGWLQWPVTVVSSNFVSLQLIFTLSLAVHLVVRCQEALTDEPDASARQMAREAVRHTLIPCLFASLTTIAGFASLALSALRPVASFGRMMSLGVLVSLALTFLLFPAGVLILGRPRRNRRRNRNARFLRLLARITERRSKMIFASSALLAGATALGFTRITVENSFIDYFQEDSEIHRGMAFLDTNFGGTTPLDITLDFPPATPPPVIPETDGAATTDSDFEDFDQEGPPTNDQIYWLTATKLERIARVHEFLARLPEIGKVRSLATLSELGEALNEGEPLDELLMTVFLNGLPAETRDELVAPYVSYEHDQARISVRIRDSMEGLRRGAFLDRLRDGLRDEVGLNPEEYQVSGLTILYSNMLQSLLTSQVSTAAYTAGALFGMFWLLFRSALIAAIALIPSLLSSLAVIGAMGLAGIPLDLMTITIIAISTGIAVDDTIHYLHRFRRELTDVGNYMEAMQRSHAGIGPAMQTTTLAISFGFSILALSSFVPTQLFGLLTATAMTIALVASLTLLPRLVLLTRPFGTQGEAA